MARKITAGILALVFCFLCLPGLLPSAAAEEAETALLRYAANDGTGEIKEISVRKTHLRLNTALGGLFQRDGYTLYAWNTAPDGSGTWIGLGSRTDAWDELLYAQWAKWSDASLFTVENGAITAWLGSEETVAVPAEIGGMTIHTIAEGAFRDCGAKTVILPPTIRTLAVGAFENAAVETLVLFDSVQSISDYSFRNCAALRTLRLNAAGAPAYAGTYYSTFADKYDRLLSLADERKIVLFSGSSARFGYDSAAIDEAFPGYAVVNMGVFAYTNALPQLELIRAQMKAGDVLLVSPELDAAKRQFCTTKALDAPFFNLMEANYDMLAALDLREYSLVFSSLSVYLSVRSSLERHSFEDSPADYDEDRNPVSGPSYNEYGDYILYRPNASDDAPIYGLEVPYTASFYRKELYIEPFNAEMRRFTGAGILCYMTYSPRNRLAVSADSTEEAIAELDRYLRENVEIPVISDLFDSLVEGRWLYGTDNHLSTEGVGIRTQQVIRDLSAAMEKDGIAVKTGRRGEVSAALRPLALSAFAAALLLTILAVLWEKGRCSSYLGGLCWAAGAVLAWLAGVSLRELLAVTLLLLALSGLRTRREVGP